jgi:class 3 adenylate cyclase
MTDAKSWLTKVRNLERSGEFLLAYDTGLQGLASWPDDVWLGHRAVLNLAKAGATRRAELEFERLGLDRCDEPDIAALGARIAKDKALASSRAGRSALLAEAADRYEAIYRRHGGYYPAINAATLRLLAGTRGRAEAIAREVLALCRAAPAAGEEAYYAAASEAEAHLVLGDAPAAQEALGRASALSTDLAARAATRRQLRLVAEARAIDSSVLAALKPPTVVAYTGHIISAPGVSGRFRADDEPAVAAQICAMLSERSVGFGYGALASGADILFAEALLAKGAELHVVLPFARDEFIDISVRPAGPRWAERFETCFASASTVTHATDDRYLGDDSLFAYASYVSMGLAVLRAQYIDADVRQIAVWDGEETTGVAGTAADLRVWAASGRAVDVISCAHAKRAAPRPAKRARSGERELRAMLFGDVKGFSKLAESQIQPFVTEVLGAIGRVLDAYEGDVLFRNTWGDGLYVVLRDADVAGRCALDLQRAMEALDLTKHGLPATLALRLGGHFGPVFETMDPVLRMTGYVGAHVSRTARIEPVTPPGEVYVTEQFAARLALEPRRFACEYVGQVPAAKDYGSMRMYHLALAEAPTSPTS